MIPFITYRETDSNGTLQYYILQKQHPHYIGIISSHPIARTLGQSAIMNHNMWVVFWGTIYGKTIPAERNVWEDIQLITDGMAMWFYKERILTETKKYKKWRIENVQIANQ